MINSAHRRYSLNPKTPKPLTPKPFSLNPKSPKTLKPQNPETPKPRKPRTTSNLEHLVGILLSKLWCSVLVLEALGLGGLGLDRIWGVEL